jgi:hypothetical protein
VRRALPSIAAVAAFALAAALSAAAASSAAAATPLPTITIAMNSRSITVGGTLVSGAVDVRSTTTGERSGSPTLVRLDQGVTYNQFVNELNLAGTDPNAVAPYGSIVFDASAPKGTTNVETKLAAGTYVALDTAGSHPPFPHTTFTVTSASDPATLPAAKATQTATDFAFGGSTVLHVGSLVRAVNRGWLVHETELFRVRNRLFGLDAIGFLALGDDQRARQLATGALVSLENPVSHGAVQQQVLRTKPGWYVEACFMKTEDGQQETEFGMERLVRVVR